jgi:hypothetical protein
LALLIGASLGTAGAAAAPALAAGSARAEPSAGPVLTNRVFAVGSALKHATAKGTQPLSKPDDITSLGGHIFVAFQNGVGPQGQPSPTGNTDSTVVEFDLQGHDVAQWELTGKCDGLTADPAIDRVIATVNEDANSSMYLIDPVAASQPVHYRYSEPLPSKGGTDAIEIDNGLILVSASAPGTTGAAAPKASYPAVYRVVLGPSEIAAVHPLFYDEDQATVANTPAAASGHVAHLALTDPDSNEVVPAYAERFAGDFMLTSQGDKEQIFVTDAGGAHQTLSVLKLSDSVDDTAWPSDSSGALYATDNGNDTVNKVTGAFQRGSVLVAVTPCDANGAPNTCPGPGYAANHLGVLDPDTGVITAAVVQGPAVAAQGLLFLP